MAVKLFFTGRQNGAAPEIRRESGSPSTVLYVNIYR